MPDWLAILILLSILFVVLIVVPTVIWRDGMKAKKFFSSSLVTTIIIMTLFYPLLATVANWQDDEPLRVGRWRFWIEVLTLCLIYLAIYTAGFVHGRIRWGKSSSIGSPLR